jgi:transcriptional regulator with XRE-family HTH domain
LTTSVGTQIADDTQEVKSTVSTNFSNVKLRRRRRELGLTHKALADALHVDISSIGHWESGRHGPSPNNAHELARVLHVPLEALLDEQPAARVSGEPVPTGKRKRRASGGATA